jgi:excisionase family DNA binding protein
MTTRSGRWHKPEKPLAGTATIATTPLMLRPVWFDYPRRADHQNRILRALVTLYDAAGQLRWPHSVMHVHSWPKLAHSCYAVCTEGYAMVTETTGPTYLTAREVQQLLRIGERTLRRYVERGTLPCVQINLKRRLCRRSDVLALLEPKR